jgi:cell division transport system permease protein
MRRKLITLSRIIKSGTTNVIRNAWLAVAAIAVMVITLTIVLFSVIANATFANTIKQITDRIDISIYLKDGTSQDNQNMIIEKLKGLENVREVQFLSKDEARDQFIKDNEDDLELRLSISQADDNPIPATIRVKPVDVNRMEELNQKINEQNWEEYILRVSYQKDRKTAIDNIASATTFFRQAGIAGVVIFAVISMLIIFNTIRMAIFNRREELNIMRLLGASNWYIRGPFIVETILYGVIAAIISVALCNSIFVLSSKAFGASSLGLLDISFANDYFAKNFGLILASQLGIGILIGGVSSFIATRRYLKFKSTK